MQSFCHRNFQTLSFPHFLNLHFPIEVHTFLVMSSFLFGFVMLSNDIVLCLEKFMFCRRTFGCQKHYLFSALCCSMVWGTGISSYWSETLPMDFLKAPSFLLPELLRSKFYGQPMWAETCKNIMASYFARTADLMNKERSS